MTKQRVQIKSTEFVPKNEYILVKPSVLETEKVLESGIVLSLKPQSSMTRPSDGTVVSVGKDILDIKEADFIMWPETDGLDLEFIDGDFVLLRYKSIIGSKRNG